MSDYQLLVLFLSAGAYLPLAIGGWFHPEEINVAAYSLWLMLSWMLLYSSFKQDFSGWSLPLGFVCGNTFMLGMAFRFGGYTFNLGPAEVIILYGLVGTVVVWVTVGKTTGRWNPRILFLGGVTADIISFYPQVKQYLGVQEAPTYWMILGWVMWIAGAAINVIFVERFFHKARLAKTMREKLAVLEESAFSIENGFFMIVTVCVMIV